MKKVLIAIAAPILVAGCISTDMGTAPATTSAEAGVNAERGTGSNISRRADRATGSNIAKLKRDPDFEGWRQGYDRDDMEKIQRSGGTREPR